MIVQCEQCQTQFKVPDDKISDKGVKVRCTKCRHTFRVTKNTHAESVTPVQEKGEEAQDSMSGVDDPFAAFGSSLGVENNAVVSGGGTALDFSSVAPQVPEVGEGEVSSVDHSVAAEAGSEATPFKATPSSELESQTAWNLEDERRQSPGATPNAQVAFQPGDELRQARQEPLQDLFDASHLGMAADSFSQPSPDIESPLGSFPKADERQVLPPAEFAPQPQEGLVPEKPPIQTAPPPPAPVLRAKSAVMRADTGSKTGTLKPLNIVFKVIFAAVLAVGLLVLVSAYFNEGKVSSETLSLAYFKATFFSEVDYVTDDISNGLYETKTGKPIFFVSGKATNLGDKPVRLMVRTELVEGSTVVRHVESIAGAPPSPEELYSLGSAEDLDVLNIHVADRAPIVAPGASVPFVTTFFEYPLDLKGFRVRVSASALTQSSNL